MTAKTGTKPRFQHSYSKLNLYGSCPGSFKKRHIDKEPERPSILRDRGRLVHEINAEYVRELVSNMSAQDMALMQQTVMAVFKKQDYLPAECFEEVMDICETMSANFELDWMHVLGAEKFFSMRLGPYLYRGLKDLEIKNASFLHIIDWKTPFKITSQADVDRSLQLKSYALAGIKNHPEVQLVRVEYFHCRQGIPVWTEYEREELDAAEAQLITLIEKLEAEREFPFRPGSFCGLCDYVETCPAKQKALDEGQVIITCDDDAARYAADLVLYKRLKSDREAALKPWISEHGDVRSGDQDYGFQDVIYRTRDPKKTAELLAKEGIDPFDAGLKFDNKALDKAVLRQGSAELVQAIEAVTAKKAFSKFQAKKVVEEDA